MPNEPSKIETTSGRSSIRDWLMTTTWGNIAIIHTWIGCGIFLVRCYTSPNSHRWGMGSSHIAKVCHIMCHRRFSFRSDGNRRPKSEPPAVFTLDAYLGRWDLRCRNRNFWDASLVTLITATAVGTVIGFFSRWLDF